MTLAITTYLVVKALHVMAVLLAYGLPLAYPLLIPYVRRRHPEAMPGVHDVQHRLNQLLTGPGTALIVLFGAYMASRAHLWSQGWVLVGLAIIVAIGAVGGAVIVPASKRMAELSREDLSSASSGTVAWSAAYERVYRRYMAAELLLGGLVLVAVFVMVTKPFT